MQKNGSFTWELAVPNGSYDVRIIAGDAVLTSGDFYHILAEGQNAINGRPSTAQLWIGSNQAITVTDGRLTISNGPNAVNNKIALIEVRERPPAAPNTLVVTAAGPRQINMTWKDNSTTEQGFAVERTVAGTGSSNYQTVATLPANSTSFSDTTVVPRHDLRVSHPRVQRHRLIVLQRPVRDDAVRHRARAAAPSDLTLVSMSGNFATISWTDNSSNEEKFLIQRGWNDTAFTTHQGSPGRHDQHHHLPRLRRGAGYPRGRAQRRRRQLRALQHPHHRHQARGAGLRRRAGRLAPPPSTSSGTRSTPASSTSSG